MNIIDEFKFQKCVCNGCRDQVMLCLHISNIINITFKSIDYHYIVIDFTKSNPVHLLENSVLNDSRYKMYINYDSGYKMYIK